MKMFQTKFSNRKPREKHEQSWERRLNEKISALRTVIAILKSTRNRKLVQKKNTAELIIVKCNRQ